MLVTRARAKTENMNKHEHNQKFTKADSEEWSEHSHLAEHF